MSRAETHYKQLLARHYTWLYGGLEPNVERAVNLFAEAGLIPGDDDLAVDLGCGSGFQSLALARLGYRVLAIDSSEDLLRELRNESGKLRIQTIHDDLLHFERHLDASPSLIVCMGDTLPHLDGLEAMQLLMQDVHSCLAPKGRFVLSFRDLGMELKGDDRIIPLKSDDNTLFTCFLEYEDDYVTVNDLVYERKSEVWDFHRSSYRKVRLSSVHIRDILPKTGFEIVSSKIEDGLVTVIAGK